MHSLFEEQITVAQCGRIHHVGPLDKEFAEVWSNFPGTETFALDLDGYLEQIRSRIANLHGLIRAGLVATGGVARPADGVKAILAGAHATQMVSAILRHGPVYFRIMRDGLVRWMESHRFAKLDEVRGRLSLASSTDPGAFERANYLRTLGSWTRFDAVS